MNGNGMNRRDFFKFLGKAAAVGAVAQLAPGLLKAAEAPPPIQGLMGMQGILGPSG